MDLFKYVEEINRTSTKLYLMLTERLIKSFVKETGYISGSPPKYYELKTLSRQLQEDLFSFVKIPYGEYDKLKTTMICITSTKSIRVNEYVYELIINNKQTHALF